MESTTQLGRPLEGRVAVVTGGSRGIGAGIARELGRRGASVVITYVTSPKKAEEVVRDVGSGRALAVQADCAMAAASASKVIAATVERFRDRIDIVVNNAANGTDQTLEQVDTDVFNTMFHTNVLFPLLLIKEATTYLGRQARIVNISSAGARASMPYSILYAATKAALESVTRSLAAQFGPSHEATVNAVNPGPVATDMWVDTATAEIEALIVERTLAAKRLGQVDDIAPIVAFLCDPSARWVTGNVTSANGGLICI